MRAGKTLRALVVALAIVAAVVAVRQRPADEPQAAATSTIVTSSSPTVSSEPASTTPTDKQLEDAAWERTARSFIRRYLNAKGSKAAWLARLRPVVSDDFYRSLKTVRLANLPSGAFGPGEVQQTAEVGGVMRFPLRGDSVTAVDVTVSVSDEGRLRVTAVEPVED